MHHLYFAPPSDAAQRGPYPVEPAQAGASAAPGGIVCAASDARGRPTDFDFLHGEWLVENRRTPDPFAPAARWIAFDAVHDCRPLASGGGHLEEPTTEVDDAGAVLRLYDARERRWTVYRICTAVGTLGTILTGGFENGLGVFVGEDTWRGRPVLVRETWTRVTTKPRWEQALSADGGATWRTRWIRELIRVDWAR